MVCCCRTKSEEDRKGGLLTVRTGYETFFTHIGDYDLHGAPMSWTRVVAMRHALTKFPDAKYVWFLGQDSLIMDPKISIHRDIMGHDNLEQSMLREQPVALPDSVIKTSRQLAPDQVELALTQDKAGMSPESMILKNGEWAEFFLDTWYDPLFRSYNFKKAEVHALVSSLSRLWAFIDALARLYRLTLGAGTHCPVAQNNPVQAGDPTSADSERVQRPN